MARQKHHRVRLKKGGPKPMQIRAREQEVLDNVQYYEVRKFIGQGKWDVFRTLDADLEAAKRLRDYMAPKALIYAVGPIPSAKGEIGVCFVE